MYERVLDTEVLKHQNWNNLNNLLATRSVQRILFLPVVSGPVTVQHGVTPNSVWCNHHLLTLLRLPALIRYWSSDWKFLISVGRPRDLPLFSWSLSYFQVSGSISNSRNSSEASRLTTQSRRTRLSCAPPGHGKPRGQGVCV